MAMKLPRLAPIAVFILAVALLGCHGGASSPDAKIDHVLNECTWPACVTDLFATCVPSGTCAASIDRATGSLTMCFSNGVTTRRTGTLSLTTNACKKDGTLSFSMEQEYRRTGNSMSFSFTLKNGQGSTVADGNSSDTGTVVTCAGGDTYALPANCNLSPTGSVDGGSTSCFELPSCSW
jgi:hypothetical protein